jgi:hypothetical protein
VKIAVTMAVMVMVMAVGNRSSTPTATPTNTHQSFVRVAAAWSCAFCCWGAFPCSPCPVVEVEVAARPQEMKLVAALGAAVGIGFSSSSSTLQQVPRPHIHHQTLFCSLSPLAA